MLRCGATFIMWDIKRDAVCKITFTQSFRSFARIRYPTTRLLPPTESLYDFWEKLTFSKKNCYWKLIRVFHFLKPEESSYILVFVTS